MVEYTVNKSPASDIKADRLVPSSQNTHNTKNALNQVDYKYVKPEPLVESLGLLSRKQPKTTGVNWTEVFDELKSTRALLS